MKRRQIIEIYRKKNRFERLCNYLEGYQKLYIYILIHIHIQNMQNLQTTATNWTEHTTLTQHRKQAKRRKTKQCYKYEVFWRGTSSTKEERKVRKKWLMVGVRWLEDHWKKNNNKQTNVAKNIKRKTNVYI